MKSANAFSYSISGSFTEDQISDYGNYIERSASLFKNAGGWLAEQANKTLENFNEFVSSRAWEMGKRILGRNEGEYVSRYQIGYLGSVHGLQNADGFMRDVIMAHPELMQLYQDDLISGYEGEFSKFCTGIGEDNLYWRRMWNGVPQLTHDDEKVAHVKRSQFSDSIGGRISFREIVDSHKTHRAIDHHLANSLFDVTSQEGKDRKKPGQAEE